MGTPLAQKKKLGFLGGTFNPIHNGHLRLAEEARRQFGLRQVLFIPNHIPPHRSASEQNVIEGEKRYVMSVLATLSNPDFLVSELELKRQGISYTYDTAIDLRNTFPDSELFLISGADTLIHHVWRRFGDLLDALDGVLVASREGEGLEKTVRKLKTDFPSFPSKCKEIKMTPIPISATDLRNRIRIGQGIEDLVPPLVKQFIDRYGLYREIPVPNGTQRGRRSGTAPNETQRGRPTGSASPYGGPTGSVT